VPGTCTSHGSLGQLTRGEILNLGQINCPEAARQKFQTEWIRGGITGATNTGEVAQIGAAQNARVIADSNRTAIQEVGRKLDDKTYKCKQNYLNSDLTCK